jgi:hypothetical protein
MHRDELIVQPTPRAHRARRRGDHYSLSGLYVANSAGARFAV